MGPVLPHVGPLGGVHQYLWEDLCDSGSVSDSLWGGEMGCNSPHPMGIGVPTSSVRAAGF